MSPLKTSLPAILFFAFTGAFAQIPSDEIIGQKSVVLSKPLLKNTADEMRAGAQTNFGAQVRRMLLDYYNTPRDSGDPLVEHYLQGFIEHCRAAATYKTGFAGHTWSVSYSLNADSLKTIITEFNSRYDFRAMHAYTLLLDAEKDHDDLALLRYAVQSLCLASAHIGEPLKNPGTSAILADDAKATLQKCLDKLSLTTSTLVISGACGVTRTNPIAVSAKIGDAPFAGCAVLATIPRVLKPFSVQADNQGVAWLPSFRIPYAAFRGTFLSIETNFGAMLDSGRGLVLTAGDLGIGASPTLVIFKTESPTFKLDYSLSAANTIPIPKDFLQGDAIRKFLRDTCTLGAGASPTQPADLTITVQCQLSSYTFDETEQTVLKTEALITITENRADGKSLQRSMVVDQKGYDYRSDAPIGAFLWESMGKLKQIVRGMLYEM
ncbi:MAG: hypothetical protein PHC61_17790 [Chitinivibrionales bacterium]|nr:hypothetical protein [Chitinivibrionales bacterium]